MKGFIMLMLGLCILVGGTAGGHSLANNPPPTTIDDDYCITQFFDDNGSVFAVVPTGLCQDFCADISDREYAAAFVADLTVPATDLKYRRVRDGIMCGCDHYRVNDERIFYTVHREIDPVMRN